MHKERLTQLSHLPPHLVEGADQRKANASVQAEAHAQFPLKVPAVFRDLINWQDPDDPLLKQVLPTSAEQSTEGNDDPVGELASRAPGGLVHKYRGRALLVASSACDIHCRYCFRRHFPYESAAPDAARWHEAVRYLRDQPDVTELILSGGDPLTLSNRRLAELSDALEGLPQLRRLRIHTRTPLVKPDRVDAGLIRWLSDLPWPVTVVLHCNHPRELGASGRAAARKIRQTGATVLNQSVLLAGVNDNTETLVELSEALFAEGILPYYLHQLDPVRGAGHFAVPDKRARELHDNLRRHLPGYLVPRLVSDPPGSESKQPLNSQPEGC